MLSPITRNRFWQQQILHCWKWSFLWYQKYILTDYLKREDSPREIFAVSGEKNNSHAWIQRIFFREGGIIVFAKGLQRRVFGGLFLVIYVNSISLIFPGVLDPPFRIRAWSWYRPAMYLFTWLNDGQQNLVPAHWTGTSTFRTRPRKQGVLIKPFDPPNNGDNKMD